MLSLPGAYGEAITGTALGTDDGTYARNVDMAADPTAYGTARTDLANARATASTDASNSAGKNAHSTGADALADIGNYAPGRNAPSISLIKIITFKQQVL